MLAGSRGGSCVYLETYHRTTGRRWRSLCRLYREALGAAPAYRVVLSRAEDPLAVVRVIVRGAESFSAGIPRVGQRLAKVAEELAARGSRGPGP